MSFLETLNRDDRDLIISLPYRVGLWISHADDAGGDSADDEEAKALENILDGFTREVFGSELVQIVMTETVTHKECWEGPWSKDLQKVPEECQRALDILHDAEIEEKEISAYKQRLIEIGEAVALAFREYDELGFLTKLRVYTLYYKERYKASKRNMSYKSLDQFLNISLKERKALYNLSSVLDVPYS